MRCAQGCSHEDKIAHVHDLCLRMCRRDGNKLSAARSRARKRQMQIEFDALKKTTQNAETQNKILTQQACQLVVRCQQAEQDRDFAIQQLQHLNEMVQQRDSAIQTCEQWKDLCAIQREVINQRLVASCSPVVTSPSITSCLMSDASLSHFT